MTAFVLRADVLADLQFPDLDFEPTKPDRVQLDNGLTLFLLPDDELPVFDLVAYFPSGDVHDPPDKIGLASLTATVLRTGGSMSWPSDKLNEELEFIAGSIEASMAAENATVSLSVMSKDTDFGLELFADVLMHPAFAEDQFQIAQNQAIEDVRRQNDNHNRIASRTVRQIVYGGHPYGNVPTLESLEAITRDDLIAFHRDFYSPTSMFVAVSGDFDKDHVIKRLESLLADWPAAKDVPDAATEPTDTGAHGVFHVEKDVNQTAIWMGHLGIRRTNPDWFALRVLNEILGGSGFTSRMMREVRSNRGLAYVVQTWFDRENEGGMFFAASGTKPSTTVQAISLMRDIIREIRETPVSEDELLLARDSIINSFIFSYTSSAQIAEQDLRLEFFGYPDDYLATYTDKIAAVDEQAVLSVAKQYLHPDDLTIVTVGQRALFDAPLEDLGPVTELQLDTPSQ